MKLAILFIGSTIFVSFCQLLLAQESTLPPKSKDIVQRMEVKIRKARVDAIQELSNELRLTNEKRDSSASSAIETTIVMLNKELENTQKVNLPDLAVVCDRKTLDQRLEFVGLVPDNASWVSENILIGANDGTRPNSVTHGNYVAAEFLFGQPLVLYCHPVSDKIPGIVNFSNAIAGQRGKLVILMRNYPTGDAKAQILVNDKPVFQAVLDGDRWQKAIVPLDGKTPVIKLQVIATGWFVEHCLFTYDIIP